MYMSDQEILYKVRLQKGDPKYVSVLAQLNGCPIKQIEKILQNASWSFYDGNWHWPKEVSDPRTSAKIVSKVKKKDLQQIRSESVLGSIEVKEKQLEKATRVAVIKSINKKLRGSKEMASKKSPRLTKEQQKEILAWYKAHMKEGITYEDVCKEFNCTVWQVGAIIRKANIVVSSGRKRNGELVKAEPVKATPIRPIEQEMFNKHVPTKSFQMTNNLPDSVDRELTIKLKDSIDNSINKKMRELQDLYELKNTLEQQIRRGN